MTMMVQTSTHEAPELLALIEQLAVDEVLALLPQ